MNAKEGFSKEQQAYLQGLVLGNDVARKIHGLPVLSGSVSGQGFSAVSSTTFSQFATGSSADNGSAAGTKLCPEETAKGQTSPEKIWHDIAARADRGQFPKGMEVFLSKCQGLFYVAPAQNAFMCRLRLPGGVLRHDQLTGLAELVDQKAAGHVDITTRANLQIREITASDSSDLLMGLRDLGIVALGAGADNIRNVTCSPLSGIDKRELIETLPLARKLHYHILNTPALYNLPRKFNIAFDGGGTISSLSETNDISWIAETLSASATESSPVGVYFRLGLGGITGHGDFAAHSEVIAKPDECIALSEAILKVFIAHGDRSDRKRARLKYLLDAWGHEKFLNAVEQAYGRPLRRCPRSAATLIKDNVDRWVHVGIHDQLQAGRAYVGVFVPAARLTSQQLRGIGAIAREKGSGHIRLTVWQNFIIPDVAHHHLPEVQLALAELNLEVNPSAFQAGMVACTGNAGCKFAAADTKRHSLELAEYLQSRLQLDQPINIHLTGCHHSCAQHAIGDIGLLATKVSIGEDMVEGYHVLIGGRTGVDAAIGQALVQSVPFVDVPALLECMIGYYLEQRQPDQSFAAFAGTHDWQRFLSTKAKLLGVAT